MDTNTIMQLINACGFPIVCVIGLGVYIKELNRVHRQEMQEMTKKIEELSQNFSTEIIEMRKELSENIKIMTVEITKLVIMLGGSNNENK